MRFYAYVVGVSLVLAGGQLALAAERPVAVSPGSAGQIVQMAEACPTFSWAGVDAATGYQLTVYNVTEQGGLGEEAVRKRLPAGASTWTPATDGCLVRGGTYAWTIGAVGRKGEVVWSEPVVFKVRSAPSQQEFEEALAVVRQYLVGQGAAGATLAAEAEAEGALDAKGETSTPSTDTRAAASTALQVDLGVEAASFKGDGSELTSLDAGKLTTGTVPLQRGGTGATTAAEARANLNVVAGPHIVDTDTTCNGADCDLRDSTLASCESVGTNASGNLTCGNVPTAVYDGGNSATALTSSPAVVASVTVDQATSGRVILGSSATVWGNLSQASAECSITTSAATIDDNYRQQAQTLTGDRATIAGTRGYIINKALPFVPATQIYNLVCAELLGDTYILDANLSAIFVPDPDVFQKP